MIERGSGGTVVNISSVASSLALENHTAYCSSKGALDQVTSCMALELGPHKVSSYYLFQHNLFWYHEMVTEAAKYNYGEVISWLCCLYVSICYHLKHLVLLIRFYIHK